MPKRVSKKKTGYLVNYAPLPEELETRIWKEDYRQIVSVDPAYLNYALRIERHYKNGRVVPLVFDKVAFVKKGDKCLERIMRGLFEFLDKYKDFFLCSHIFLVEQQPPKSNIPKRISQSTIAYFTILMRDSPLKPSIFEVSGRMKGDVLHAPRGMDLKIWSIREATTILRKRSDDWSIEVMECFPRKKDDLADTVCQIEAFIRKYGLSFN